MTVKKAIKTLEAQTAHKRKIALDVLDPAHSWNQSKTEGPADLAKTFSQLCINDEIKKLKQQDKEIPKHLFSLRIDAIRLCSNLTEKKGSFTMRPPMDEALEKKIDERIKEHGNARTDS